MLARDVMTPHVTTVTPDTPIRHAIAKMVAGRISGVPVLDAQGHLAGILTEGDLLRRIELGTEPHRPGWLSFLRGPGLAASDYIRTRTMHVSDIMTAAPVTVGPADTLEQIVGLMERKHVKRVPVVENGALIGIISRGDLMRALSGLLAGATVDARDDEAIRTDIIAELHAQNWSALSNVAVSVESGRVTLEGIAQTEAVRNAVRVAAETIGGVVAVDNRIAIPDPMVMAIGA